MVHKVDACVEDLIRYHGGASHSLATRSIGAPNNTEGEMAPPPLHSTQSAPPALLTAEFSHASSTLGMGTHELHRLPSIDAKEE